MLIADARVKGDNTTAIAKKLEKYHTRRTF
jgi:hypothetical protein